MRTYKVELTFGEACKTQSAIEQKIELYRGFLRTAKNRNDHRSTQVWQDCLDEYNSVRSKLIQTTEL